MRKQIKILDRIKNDLKESISSSGTTHVKKKLVSTVDKKINKDNKKILKSLKHISIETEEE